MTRQKTQDIAKQVGMVAEMAALLSLTTDHDVFFEYSPHVGWAYVRIYPNGWSKKAIPCHEKANLDVNANLFEVASAWINRTIEKIGKDQRPEGPA